MVTPGVSLKVLILKDSEDDALLIVDELRRGGFDPTYKRVESRERFTEELSEGWELILADVSLPSFSGGDALKVLNEGGGDIPLIAISGTLSEEAAVSLLRSGAKDFIVKTNLSRLVPAVRRELGEASVRRKQRLLEQELKESEELNQSILENSPTPISITVDARIVYANPSRLKLTGASTLEEIFGQDGRRFIHPDDLDYVHTRNRAFEEGKPVPEKYEYRCLRSDGSYANIEALTTMITYQGKPALLHVLHDVTQRKEYEAQLTGLHGYARDLATAETLGEAARVVGDVVQRLLKTRNGGVGFVEGRALRFKYLFGNEFIGEIAMPLDGPGITTRAIRTGETQLIPDVTLDGGYYLVASNIVTRSEVAVPIKVNGEIVAVINVEHPLIDAYTQNDVRILEMLGNHFSSAVQRIRAAEALRASEAKYKSFLDNLRDAVFVLDNDTYLYANQAGADMLGYDSPMDIVGLPSYSIVSPEEREVMRLRTVARARGEDVPSRYELRLMRRDGGVVPVEVNVSRIMYMGKPASLAVHRDISERRRYVDKLHDLHNFALKLGQASDIPEVYSITFQEIAKTIVYRRCGVLVIEDGVLRDTHLMGYGEDVRRSLPLDGRGITVRAARTGETVYAPDVRLDPDYIEGAPGVDVKSEFAVPVKVYSKVVAVLNVERNEINAFTEEDRRLLEILANHTASALTQLDQVTDLRGHERRLMALNKCASDLLAADSLDRIWDIMLGVLEKEFNQKWVGIGVVSGDHLKYVKFLGVPPLEEIILPLNGPGVTVRALRTGETQLVKDVTKDKDFVASNMGDASQFPALSELAVPIRVGSKLWAVINVESTSLDAFDENDRTLLEILAGHVGEAIDRLKHIRELEAAEAHMTALHGYTGLLSEARTIDEAAEVTCNVITELLNTTNGSLSLVENGALHFRYIYGTVLKGEYVQPLSGPGITVRAAVTGESQLVPDVTRDVDYTLPEGVEIATRSELAVPIKLGGGVVAVVNAESTVVDAFTENDQRLLEILAGHLSSTLARIREEEAREKHRSRLESLHTIVLQLDGTQTLDQANETASNLLQSFYGALHAKIVLVEGEELVSVPTRGYSTGIPRLPLNGGGITVRAVKEGRTIYVEDIKVDLDYVEGDSKTLSELVVPLWHEGKVIGVLNLESPSKNGFTVDDIRLAETFASHISATLTRIRLAEEQQRTLEATLRQEAAAERARELATVKTRFLSTATHEIRTPLTSIRGYTELIQNALQTGDTSQLPAYFDAVRRNAERLTRLTDDLLDTQRIEEGKMMISRLPVETSDLLSDLTQEATPGLTRRGQTLEVRDGFNRVISVDRDRVIQVLANLVGNASKFSPEGSTIRLSVEMRGGEALFTVHDQGVGLTEEDVLKLFKPFPGIHVEGNREGTGLGLSICRGIIELHGGRMWAESGGPGKGSTFSFTVPVVEP